MKLHVPGRPKYTTEKKQNSVTNRDICLCSPPYYPIN